MLYFCKNPNWLVWLGTLVSVLGTHLFGQENQSLPLDGGDGRPLALQNFRPESTLKTQHSLLTRAKYPVVNAHSHLSYRLKDSPERLDEFVRLMDRNQVRVCVSLDGRLGEKFELHKEYLWEKYRDRFVIFTHIDWLGDGKQEDPKTWDCHRPDFVRRTVQALRAARRSGASGLKIFKRFGLEYRNPDDSLIRIDDPRWDPIWAACGQLQMPVIIHTADPAAFFLPIDSTNERWEELARRPGWSFYGEGFPTRDALLAARNAVVRRHPETIFIGAHVANNAEDLATVDRWLIELPNLYVEIASRISELGRQPYTARRFLVKHADRVLFGTDGPWPEERLHLYWRFLETFDEYIPYSEKPFPPQGFWQIYGIALPDDVLKKIYHENAMKIIPGVKERLQPAR